MRTHGSTMVHSTVVEAPVRIWQLQGQALTTAGFMFRDYPKYLWEQVTLSSLALKRICIAWLYSTFTRLYSKATQLAAVSSISRGFEDSGPLALPCLALPTGLPLPFQAVRFSIGSRTLFHFFDKHCHNTVLNNTSFSKALLDETRLSSRSRCSAQKRNS